jgi:multidrug efflux pump
VIAEGAGAEMRRTLGIAVFSGMLGVTLFGIFLTPVFYYVIQWFKDRTGSNQPAGREPRRAAVGPLPRPESQPATGIRPADDWPT